MTLKTSLKGSDVDVLDVKRTGRQDLSAPAPATISHGKACLTTEQFFTAVFPSHQGFVKTTWGAHAGEAHEEGMYWHYNGARSRWVGLTNTQPKQEPLDLATYCQPRVYGAQTNILRVSLATYNQPVEGAPLKELFAIWCVMTLPTIPVTKISLPSIDSRAEETSRLTLRTLKLPPSLLVVAGPLLVPIWLTETSLDHGIALSLLDRVWKLVPALPARAQRVMNVRATIPLPGHGGASSEIIPRREIVAEQWIKGRYSVGDLQVWLS